VERRQILTLDDLQGLPSTTVTRDLHCVTRWTRLDNTWTGVRVAHVLALARPRTAATHAVVSGHPAYSTNLDVEVLREDDVLLAWAHDGQPLPAAHGGPLRLVVPSRYGWKSVKWVFEIRLLDRDVPGYWEERGYHDVGDPWREQRFSDDP
jgi:DMSO/TMAO reductase YedYZ molybdopterin-dependent catalytic subunit